MMTDDTISRQEALDEIDRNRRILLSLGMNEEEYILFHYGRRVIEELQIIDPVKHGKWILKKELVPLPWDCDPLDWDNYDESTHSEWEEFYHCSNCDYKSGHFKGTSYCPNCGARMDDVEKIGHWVDHIKDFWCSECGCRILPEQVTSFSKCPSCGANMERSEE